MGETEIIRLIQTIGVPATALLAIAWATWKVAIWLANSMISPLMQRHLKFLDEFSDHMQAQNRAMIRIVENQNEIARGLAKLFDSTEFRHFTEEFKNRDKDS